MKFAAKSYKIILFACLGLGIINTSCTSSNAETEKTSVVKTKKATIEIPELMAREAILGSEKEEALYKKKYNEFSKALNKNPKDHTAALGLAELFMSEARITGEHPYYYPAALKMIDVVLENDPKDNEILFPALSLKSSVLLSLHQFENALVVAKKAVEINPYNANIYGSLVDANVELGNYTEAVKMTDKMISVRPDLRSYSRVSYLREIHGDVEGAKEAMDLAVKAGYPGYETTAWARYTLGKINENYGDLPNAEMHYRIALQERPNYAFAMHGLASLEMKKENWEKAEEILNEAIKILPEVSFYESLADLYLETGKEEESKKIALQIIEMMGEDEEAGHKMDLSKAEVYSNLLNDDKKALDLALNEYKARPDNIDVNLLISQILLKSQKGEEAKKYIEVASKTKSKKPELFLCKGLLALETADQEAAVSNFKRALELNPYLKGYGVSRAKEMIN